MQSLKVILTQPEQPNQHQRSTLPKSLGALSHRESSGTGNRSSRKNSDFCIRVSPRVTSKQWNSPPSKEPRSGNPMLTITPPQDELEALKPVFRLQKPRTSRAVAQTKLSLHLSSPRLPEQDEKEEMMEYAKGLSGPLEEEKLVSADEKPQDLIGDEVVEKFYHHYKNLAKIKDQNGFKNIKDSMYTSVLTKSEDLGMLPSKIGLIKDKGANNKLKISHYRIGDKYAKILSEGLKTATGFNKFELSHNRLSPNGAQTILSNLPNRPEFIDLSGNKIGKIGIEHLCTLLMQRNTRLLEINLEGNKLGDYALGDLCDAISDNDTVRKLNLSRNFLTNKAAVEIGKMLKNNSSLEEIYLRWNQIQGSGGAAVIEGMKANPHIRVLDLSWNSLGKPQSTFANSFVDFIVKDKRLVHLDLSNNYINKTDAISISKALESNHTLYGFHFQGNVGFVDPKGFLVIPEEFQTDVALQSVQPPIDGVSIMADNLKRYHQYSGDFKNVCWICEGWTAMEIKWEPGVSGQGDQDPVYVHLSYEGHKGRYLPKSKGFRTVRMVPPIEFSYIFNVEDMPTCADDHPSQQYYGTDIELKVNDKKRFIKTDFVNYREKIAPCVVIDEDFAPIDDIIDLKIQPRMPDDVYIPPEVKIQKAIWKFPISAFKEFKPDTHPMLDKCFEVDFEGTRIAKLVKTEQDLKQIRDMLYNVYRPLKDCYKHYSAIGAPSEIWSIPLNTYTEFCLAAGIIDGKLMKLSDFDRVFIATYTKTDKERNSRNPDRALVRYQFLEGLVRMADQKYISNGLANSIPEALKILLDDNVKPFVSKFDHQKWRVDKYWNEQVDCVVKSYLPILKGVYKKYSGLRTLPGQRKFMCLEEFNSLVSEMGLLNDNCGERDATLFFNLGMMTQIDELNSDRIYQMQFVEFLEAFARVVDKFAAAPWGKTEAEIPYEQRLEQPLQVKLEGTMQRMYNICGADIKDIWVMPETSIFEMPETKGKVKYSTKKKKLVRVDPTEPNSADAYGL